MHVSWSILYLTLTIVAAEVYQAGGKMNRVIIVLWQSSYRLYRVRGIFSLTHLPGILLHLSHMFTNASIWVIQSDFDARPIRGIDPSQYSQKSNNEDRNIENQEADCT